VRIFRLTRGPTCGRLAVMAYENTVPVLLSMRAKCWCGYANDQDFLLDMPHDKAQPMEALELTACPDCGAPIRVHLKRTSMLQ
jgi:hypothetical protein